MRNVTARGGIHSGGLRAEGIRRAWLKYFVVQMARGAVPSGLGSGMRRLPSSGLFVSRLLYLDGI